MNFWSFLKKLLLFRWLFGSKNSGSQSNSTPYYPYGGGYTTPRHSSHDHLPYSGGVGGIGGDESGADEYYDSDYDEEYTDDGEYQEEYVDEEYMDQEEYDEELNDLYHDDYDNLDVYGDYDSNDDYSNFDSYDSFDNFDDY